MHPKLHCFRCRLIELEPSQRGPELGIFFDCPSCGASYTFENGGPLVDRWLMPVTLPIYAVLAYDSPEGRAEGTVLQLLKSLAARSPAARQRFMGDIEAELALPRQPLHKVLPDPHEQAPDREAALRRFLRQVAESLRRLNAQE